MASMTRKGGLIAAPKECARIEELIRLRRILIHGELIALEPGSGTARPHQDRTAALRARQGDVGEDLAPAAGGAAEQEDQIEACRHDVQSTLVLLAAEASEMPDSITSGDVLRHPGGLGITV